MTRFAACARVWQRAWCCPESSSTRMLPQLQVHLEVAPENTQFWHPVEKLPEGTSEADRKRLTSGLSMTRLQTVIQPAYQRLYDFLRTEYLPHARQTDGLGGLPGGQGKALYAYYVRYHTTTDMTPGADP